MTTTTDLSNLLRDAFNLCVRSENIVPLLVDALIVVTVGTCTLGIALPAMLRGYTAMAMRIARGETVAVGDSLKGFEHFGDSLVLGILVLAVAVVLTILPLIGTSAGLILGMWVMCLHVDNPSRGAVDTFMASVDIVKRNPLDTVILWLVTFAVTTGLSFTIVGSVAAVAFSVMTITLAYRQFSMLQGSTTG
jgi:hypothetical protein